MNVNVQLFARARDLAGTPLVSLDLDGQPTVAVLRRALIQLRPALGPIGGSLHIAVNGEYADDSLSIPPQAEIACFPPVSGG